MYAFCVWPDQTPEMLLQKISMKILDEAINTVVADALQAERIVGTSILVAKKGEVICEIHAGFADREASKPVSSQTIFRLASMTKPIVSTVALALIEENFLSLDSPVARWLPSFKPRTMDGKVADISVRHLLTHTSGLTYGFLSSDNEPYFSAGVSDGIDESVLSLEENLERLAKVPLLFAPGSAWCYSLSTDVLGAVIEGVTRNSLAEVVSEYITSPLGMRDTAFGVSEENRLAKAYADSGPDLPARRMKEKDQVLLEGCGPIHYAPGRITNPAAYASGGSGMAGTAVDYLKFLEVIRQGGHPVLSADSVNLLTQDAVAGLDVAAAGPGYGFGMGFAVVRDSVLANTPRNKGSYDWGGVYGTKMFVDPAAELSVVMLTNTALEGLGKFPEDITSAIYTAF